jgi:hypothetical protein
MGTHASKTSNLRTFMTAWALLAILLGGARTALQFSKLARLEHIRENHAQTIGAFTAKDCGRHGSR